MQAFRFFDPWAAIENAEQCLVPAKAANPAKVETADSGEPAALATLAALATAPGEVTNLPSRCKGEEARAAIFEFDGVSEIPDEPVLLRDGRRLWRFPQAQGGTTDQAAALIDRAHWCGAVLVADGDELIVVERWLSSLPVETLCELRRCASGVIAALHQQSRVRHQPVPRLGQSK